MKKHIKTLSIILSAVVIAISFSACGGEDDEPNNPNENQDPTENVNPGGGNGNSSSDITNIVKNNVKKSAYYSDFYVHIKLEHTLPSLISAKKIEYKFLHGERNSYEASNIVSNRNPIYPTVSQSGSKVTVTIDYPYYYYFIYKTIVSTTQTEKEDYERIWTRSEQYLASYEALLNRPSLDQEEQNFLSNLKKYMNEYVSIARGLYTITVVVVVDGKTVVIGNLDAI